MKWRRAADCPTQEVGVAREPVKRHDTWWGEVEPFEPREYLDRAEQRIPLPGCSSQHAHYAPPDPSAVGGRSAYDITVELWSDGDAPVDAYSLAVGVRTVHRGTLGARWRAVSSRRPEKPKRVPARIG